MQLRMLAAAVLAIAGAWGCGGGSGSYDSGSPTAPSTTTPPPSAATIVITSTNGAQSFSPNPASLGGQMVVFRNNDTMIHRVRLNDGSLDTGPIAPGASSSPLLMPAAGTNYHCTLHPTMIGAVAPSGGGPPPACVEYC